MYHVFYCLCLDMDTNCNSEMDCPKYYGIKKSIRKAVKIWSKKEELKDLSTIINADDCMLYVFTIMRHIQQELKSIYMCQDVRIAKNTTILNVRYIVVMIYNKCLRTHFYICVMQCFSFVMRCWRKDDLSMASTGFGTSSNHSGPSQIFRALLFLRYLCHRSFGQIFCTYIYAVKWNVDRTNEINKLLKAWYKVVTNTI